MRVVLGLTMAAHGSQKLFGWFNGPGLRGTGGFFGSMRFRLPAVLATTVALAEFCGGLLMTLGLFTPFAALAFVSVMARQEPEQQAQRRAA